MKLSFLQNLATRLVFSHMVVGAVTVGLIASIAGYFIQQSGQREVENNIEDLAFILSNDLENAFVQVGANNPIDLAPVQLVLKSDLVNRPKFGQRLLILSGDYRVESEFVQQGLSRIASPESLSAVSHSRKYFQAVASIGSWPGNHCGGLANTPGAANLLPIR